MDVIARRQSGANNCRDQRIDIGNSTSKNQNTSFTYVDQDVPEADYIDFLKKNDYYAITRIPANVMNHAEIPVFSTSQVPMELKNEIASQLRQKIESVKRAEVIAKTQMPDLEAELDATKTPVLVRTLLVTDTGDTKEARLKSRLSSG